MKIATSKRGSIPAFCQAVLVRGDVVWKCGNCGCGNVIPKLRDKCAVCGAKVVYVDPDSPRDCRLVGGRCHYTENKYAATLTSECVFCGRQA